MSVCICKGYHILDHILLCIGDENRKYISFRNHVTGNIIFIGKKKKEPIS